MKTEEIKTIVLTPEEGHFLTQSVDVDIRERLIVDIVALGRHDTPDAWREITNSEAEEYQRLKREAKEADIAAMEAKEADLKNEENNKEIENDKTR